MHARNLAATNTKLAYSYTGYQFEHQSCKIHEACLHSATADMAESRPDSHITDLKLWPEHILRHTHTRHTMSWRALPHSL